MNNKLKQSLIAEAQQYLKENPQDLLHDFNHHARVLSLAKEIVVSEKLENTANIDVLELICWWHDVKVPTIKHDIDRRIAEETAEYVTEKLPTEIQETVFDSLKNHEFGSKPKYLEGKILQDADKLETLSLERAESIIPMVKTGQKTKQEMLKIFYMFTEKWLPVMLERYHFTFSKQYHKQNLASILTKFQIIKEELEK